MDDAKATATALLALGIDTCGPEGSVALARILGDQVQLLGETALEGRTYSATLVTAAGDLLKAHGVGLRDLDCLVVTNGPGSFTGVRVGLSAVKGLAEGAGLRVIALSRLAVLARKAGLSDAALDAHRHEVFLCVAGRELLAGAQELAAIQPPPERVAICDEGAAAVLGQTWPSAELVRVASPRATDVIALAVQRIRGGDLDDVLLLDGHYLRRSDAEIFGDPTNAAKRW